MHRKVVFAGGQGLRSQTDPPLGRSNPHQPSVTGVSFRGTMTVPTAYGPLAMGCFQVPIQLSQNDDITIAYPR